MREIEDAPDPERLAVFSQRIRDLSTTLQEAPEVGVERPDLRGERRQSFELLHRLIQHRKLKVDLTHVKIQRGVIRSTSQGALGTFDHPNGMALLPLVLLKPMEEGKRRGPLQPLLPSPDSLPCFAELLVGLSKAEVAWNELGIVSDDLLEEAARVVSPSLGKGGLARLVAEPNQGSHLPSPPRLSGGLLEESLLKSQRLLPPPLGHGEVSEPGQGPRLVRVPDEDPAKVFSDHPLLAGVLIILRQGEESPQVAFITLEGPGVMLNGFIEPSGLPGPRPPGEVTLHLVPRPWHGPTAAPTEMDNQTGGQEPEGKGPEKRR